MSTWRIPYTAPGSKGGTYTITAPSRAAAIQAMERLLLSRRCVQQPAGGRTERTLRRAEVAQIQFGEPVQVDS